MVAKCDTTYESSSLKFHQVPHPLVMNIILCSMNHGLFLIKILYIVLFITDNAHLCVEISRNYGYVV